MSSSEETITPKGKNIAAYFFDKSGEVVNQYVCKVCSVKVSQNTKKGYSNLTSHLKSKHPGWKDEFDLSRGQTTLFTGNFLSQISEKAKNIFGWLDLIVNGDLPFTVVENKLLLKYLRLDSVSRGQTIRPVFEKLILLVRDKMKTRLPDRFGVIFDGWSCDGEHYLGSFATFVNGTGVVEYRMLGCNVQDIPDGTVEVGFTAADIGDMLSDVLSRYDKEFKALEFLCGDNAYVNGSLSSLIEAYLRRYGTSRCMPLVGCASHRLNLAVQKLYGPSSEYENVVKVTTELMIELRTQKNRLLLSQLTHLTPVLANATRWGSTFLMCYRCNQLLPCLLAGGGFNSSVRIKIDAIIDERDTLVSLIAVLKKCESVSKFLQEQNASSVTLTKVRVLFDGLIREQPSMAGHLRRDAAVVFHVPFESAIVKIQRCEESKLSSEEKAAVAHLLLPPLDRSSDDDDEAESEGEAQSFALSLIEDDDEKVRKKRKIIVSQYKDTSHVSPTSNICERAFSRAKLIMTPHRRCMDPSTLDGLLFLRYNADLWKENEIEVILRELKAEAEEANGRAVPRYVGIDGNDSTATPLSSSSSSSSRV